MKGIKGRILNKLTSFPQVTYLKQDQILPTTNSSPRKVLGQLSISTSQNCPSQQPQAINVEGLANELQDNESDEDFAEEFEFPRGKENVSPKRRTSTSCSAANSSSWSWKKKTNAVAENVSSYRPPDLNSSTLFDPELLAAFREAVRDHMNSIEEAKNKASRYKDDDEPPAKVARTEELDPLLKFEYRCPPGGSNAVILYTTTLRGIRKTFEDCNSLRFLLESRKVVFYERDISMHAEFREELWRVLGSRVIPPRLFIKGRYIGGADQVLGLHEQGKLLPLLSDVPLRLTPTKLCRDCGGNRFVMCDQCRGSRKVYDGENLVAVKCRKCNENGLILCTSCCRPTNE